MVVRIKLFTTEAQSSQRSKYIFCARRLEGCYSSKLKVQSADYTD
jgi:hypothetical protein